jgi:hypothetical protein
MTDLETLELETIESDEFWRHDAIETAELIYYKTIRIFVAIYLAEALIINMEAIG